MKKYYKDYKLVPHFLPNGKLVQGIEYSGKHYSCRLNDSELKRKKIYAITLALCSAIIITVVGFISTPGSRFIYVALPYACLFLPAVYNLLGAVRFMSLGNKLEYAVLDKSINRIHRASIGQLVLSGIAVVADICIILRGMSTEELRKEMIFLSGMILMLVCGILLIRIRKSVNYEAEEELT